MASDPSDPKESDIQSTLNSTGHSAQNAMGASGFPLANSAFSTPFVDSPASPAPPKTNYPGDRRVLDGFFRLSIDMLCILASDGAFQRLNPAFGRVLGYSESELQTTSWLSIIHEDDRDEAFQSLRQLSDKTYGDEQILTLENRCRCKDGSYRWMVWNLTADTPQQLIYAVAHDVTKRRDAEEATRRADKFITSIVENIPHMIFVKDAENLRFVRINKAEEEMMGMSQAQMLGRNDYDFFPTEEADFFTNADRAVIGSGKLLDVPEETIHCAKGTRIFHTKKIPIFNDNGEPQYLLGISEDITERKHAEEELRDRNARMQADLELARAMQEAFIVEQHPLRSCCSLSEKSALTFHHRYIPDAALGGDFFHVTALSENCYAVFICDVMGHGVRSALVTAMIRALVNEKSVCAGHPGAFLTEINRHLHSILEQAHTPMFASAFYMVADAATGQFSYANAGHPSPWRVRGQAGSVEKLLTDNEAFGPALGVFDDVIYRTTHDNLDGDDLIVLYTDGIFEVQNANEEFGEARVCQVLLNHANSSPDELFDALLNEARDFSETGVFADDVCLVGVKMHQR